MVNTHVCYYSFNSVHCVESAWKWICAEGNLKTLTCLTSPLHSLQRQHLIIANLEILKSILRYLTGDADAGKQRLER